MGSLCDSFMRKPIGKTDLILDLMKFLPYGVAGKEAFVFEALPEEAQAPVIPPPVEEMEVLYDLALSGDYERMKKYPAHLERMGAHYRPFAEKLRRLIEGYEDERLLELVEEYVES